METLRRSWAAVNPAVCALGAIVLTLTLGVAAAHAADLEGVSGPLAWRIGDVRQGPTTMDGVPHVRHEFTLVVKNVGPRTVVLRGYTTQMSYAGVPTPETTASLDARLTPASEYKFQLYALLRCLDASTPCRFALGPGWRVTLSGRDSGGAEFTTPIDVTLPVESGRPVVATPSVRVSRASASSGANAERVAARFTSNVIIVPASAGGEDLWLLLDTGAQLSVLRPEVARRLGLSVSADAPVFPVMGVGGGVNAQLVELPVLRVGEHVVERMMVGIAALPDFPLPIDGVLGGNFIEVFRVTIDHRAKELRLEPAR
jgi:Aspartyl protease